MAAPESFSATCDAPPTREGRGAWTIGGDGALRADTLLRDTLLAVAAPSPAASRDDVVIEDAARLEPDHPGRVPVRRRGPARMGR